MQFAYPIFFLQHPESFKCSVSLPTMWMLLQFQSTAFAGYKKPTKNMHNWGSYNPIDIEHVQKL